MNATSHSVQYSRPHAGNKVLLAMIEQLKLIDDVVECHGGIFYNT